MPDQRKTKQPEEPTPDEEVSNTSEAVDTSDIDSLIDDIDDVLEENAEEFVRKYVQRGGE